MPRERISISGWARIVDSLCERLGLGPAAVVGNSMGGFIAAELAIAFPARVERLVLVSAAGISQTSLRRRPAVTIARGHAIVGARAVARRHDLVARPRLRHAVLSFVIRHPTLLSPEIVYEVLHGVGKKGFLPAMEALTTYDFRERLPEIGCPTLIVWGREDMVVPLADGLEFERLIASSRMLVMEDTGHVPMLERAPTFNRALSDFLAEASSVERAKAAAAA
jgi:pimeloyl-ACP methyl ester carboxylesterase